MKAPSKISKRLMGVVAATALVMPLTMIMSSAAQAAECAPLQVVGFKLINTKPIHQGSNLVGLTFQVKSYIKNTNPRLTFRGDKNTTAFIAVDPAYGSRALSSNNKLHAPLPGNRSYALTSRTVTIMRDPGNLASLKVNFKGYLNNYHCKDLGLSPSQQLSSSHFTYDLTPALTGGKPRLIRGRIRGYSERQPPRPRPGTRPGQTGAPRPRT